MQSNAGILIKIVIGKYKQLIIIPIVLWIITYSSNIFDKTRYNYGPTGDQAAPLYPSKEVHKPRWTFLGDSSLGRLYAAFIGFQKSCIVVKKCERCERDSYLGIKRRTKWFLPSKYVGPAQHGLKEPYCSDCRTCINALIDCEEVAAESIVVEFSKDVELQSLTTDTTQESVVSYLMQNPRDRCVVNTGLHDMKLEALTDEQYIKNTKQYLRLLHLGCKEIVWLSLAVVQEKRNVHVRKYFNNKRIQKWNILMKEMITNNFPDIDFIDIYTMSNFTGSLIDYVHLSPALYRKISTLLMNIYM